MKISIGYLHSRLYALFARSDKIFLFEFVAMMTICKDQEFLLGNAVEEKRRGSPG